LDSSAPSHGRLAGLENFVKPFYAREDMMHELSHIRRLLKTALSVSKKRHLDKGILMYAAYFHGMDRKKHRAALTGFLESQGLQKRQVLQVFQVASESQRSQDPRLLKA
jgi:uncharacterized protein